MRSIRLSVTAALLLCLPAVVAAQDTRGTIQGRVVEQASGQPLSLATVRALGTSRGAQTNQDGRYTIQIAPGTYELRAQRLGFAAASRTVTVQAGATVDVDFALATSAVQLDEVVTTATGQTERQRERGNSVSSINMEDVELAPITNFSELLTSRAPSVVVQQATGTTGGTSRIRIRGNNSVSLANDPLIIIDGVRVQNSVASGSIGVGGQETSRLNEINPEDIENIEIIKGPAASALYGTAAANGVIQITTRRGSAGRARWQAFAEAGDIKEVTSYPANFLRLGTRVRDGATVSCNLDSQTRNVCTPGEILSFNPLEDPTSTPFVDGWRTQYGLSLSGGSDLATYYIASDYEREQGIYDVNFNRRVNLRANVTARPTDKIDVTASLGYSDNDLEFVQNDNNLFGFIAGALLGSAIDDPDGRGWAAGFTPQLWEQAVSTQFDSDRFMGSVNGTWRPLTWLSFNGTAGLDVVQRHDHETVTPETIFSFGLDEGERTSNRHVFSTYTVNASGTGAFNLTSDIRSSTTAGFGYTSEYTRSTEAFGAKLLGGTSSLEGANLRFAVDEDNVENVTIGFFGQQQFGWKDRVFVTGALRADDNSAFGEDFGLIYYPAASVSYVISEEGFFPRSRWFNTLRLRAAFGESGQRPSFRDAVTFFSPVSVTVNNESVPAFTPGGTGNATLKPERSREFEVGFEAGLIDNRLGLDFTYYTRKTEDALIARRLAPSIGTTTTRFENLGQVDNWGYELQVNASLLQTRNFNWDLTIAGAINRNKLVELGEGVEPIIFGLGGDSQRHEEGYPLGGYWGQPLVSFEDKNGDGYISRAGCTTLGGAFVPKLDNTGAPLPLAQQPECEVVLGETQFIGNPFPEKTLTISTALNLFRYFRVSALLDHRGDYVLNNSTRQFRCASSFQNCSDAFDPDNTTLFEQARVAASLLGSDAVYFEDASFWKLREVAVTLTAPTRWASRAGLRDISLTVAGRNLKTWTDYTGFDPEVNFDGGSNFGTADFLTQPQTRVWTARLNVGW